MVTAIILLTGITVVYIYYVYNLSKKDNDEPLSTFERKMKNPTFKKAFEEGYKELLKEQDRRK